MKISRSKPLRFATPRVTVRYANSIIQWSFIISGGFQLDVDVGTLTLKGISEYCIPLSYLQVYFLHRTDLQRPIHRPHGYRQRK